MPKPATVRAWLVAYVDSKREPPCVCEAGIFPDHRPTKASRHEGFAQLVLLQTERGSYVEAADEIKQILAGPDWRWIYKVPVLTAGFQHIWTEEGARRISRIPRRQAEQFPDPNRCLVSLVGICSGCGGMLPILQGDALCVNCRLPSS